MTKSDIVSSVAEATGITKIETEAVIDGFISTVIGALKDGKDIDIRGFASFSVKKHKGKKARNPKTGEIVEIKERYVPFVKLSKQLKHSVDENLQSKNLISNNV